MSVLNETLVWRFLNETSFIDKNNKLVELGLAIAGLRFWHRCPSANI